ncbi:YpoC family protein [Solibacillus sp. FSL H8-0538]|uniref:YpoC family protein n=1 Tax=Solibacillus sp. FSL H8-0538 TaxID=2921400 RepID=UPI0030FB3769
MIEVKKEVISKEAVDAWITVWEELRENIHAAHEARDGSAKPLMEKGIEQFVTFLLQASHTDIALQEHAIYELLPINGMERLSFIKMKPGQYACYRQLDELYKETKKRCARLRLKA